MDKKIQVPLHIAKALQVIATRLKGEDIRWVVITSCALALQGLDIQPEDIDILTDTTGHKKIDLILDEFKMTLPQKSSYESVISNFLIEGRPVEVISNFKVKSAKDNHCYLADRLIEYSHNIELFDVEIPCLTLSKSIELYTWMGREKDEAKIIKIEHFLNQSSKSDA
jgi:hypothetical protein